MCLDYNWIFSNVVSAIDIDIDRYILFKMAGNRDNSLEGQLTHVIQHHMSQPCTEAQVSVHQVQNPSGSGKRHQIIIDIKQDIDMDELSTRSLAESVMETLGARSAAVYIDNSQIQGENSDMESLTTVNVIVANDLSQAAPSPQVEDTEIIEETQAQESTGILPGNRIAVDRIVEMANANTSNESTSTVTTLSVTTAATTTASGTNLVKHFFNKLYCYCQRFQPRLFWFL